MQGDSSTGSEPEADAVVDGTAPTDSAVDAVDRAEAALTAEAGSYGLDPTADCVHPPVERDCAGGWCRIPAGCFIYGSPEHVAFRGRYTEQQVQVTLTRSFVMGETEVTQAEWEAVGFANPPPAPACSQCPVGLVSWCEALAYCNALSEEEGLDPCYDLSCCTGAIGGGCALDPSDDLFCMAETNYQCNCELAQYANPYECPGYRLPTGAEWEYAARAGTRTDTYNGDLSI